MSLILVPPLGFFLLWITARTWKTRIIVLAAFLLFAAGAAGAIIKSGIYGKLTDHSVPASGFDIAHDDRGHYTTKRILPYEWQIFREVVGEMRKTKPGMAVYRRDHLTVETAEREREVFERVAGRHDMYYDDVQGIYIKVTNLLSAPQAKKK